MCKLTYNLISFEYRATSERRFLFMKIITLRLTDSEVLAGLGVVEDYLKTHKGLKPSWVRSSLESLYRELLVVSEEANNA